MKHSIKKCKKTYAIYHLAEKHTVFYLGRTKVHVSFTGGIITKKGVTPATFTTSDPIVQLAIEKSEDYSKGAIRVIAAYPQEGEVVVGVNPLIEPDAEEIMERSVQSETAASAGITGAKDAATSEEAVAEKTEAEPIVEAEATEAPGEGERRLEVVEASCKDVAKQYLQEHFGENPAPLRTRLDVQECAARHGIVFEFV